MLRRSARMGRADGGTKMKALVIGVVLVFLGGCASHVSPGGKAIESPIKGISARTPSSAGPSASENGAEAEDSPLRFRLTP